MSNRVILGTFAVLLVGLLAAAFVVLSRHLEDPEPAWKVVFSLPEFEVHQLPGTPASYAVVKGGRWLLLDCPETITPADYPTVELVLLTHSHRDTVGGAEEFVKAGVPVRASKDAAKWLNPTEVAKFWKDSIPLRNSSTGYFVHPTGIDGIDCSLTDGQTVEWNGLTIEVIGTPGHSPDHLAFAVNGVAFVGDAVSGEGKLWTPFTTDWDHWTDKGLTPASASVRTIEGRKFEKVFPARPATQVNREPTASASRITEAAFLKSFERFTTRLGDPPAYDFLVPKEQVGSNGSKPWSKVSDSLWITGNTYVLKSKDDGALMVLDPWDSRIVPQIQKLREAEKLGVVELVMFSHAHFDHFDGLYPLPEQGRCKVWALESVAEPIRDPFRFRAPFLDARPIAFDRTFKDGQSVRWREFTFKFHHLPGQTHFTSGIECTIDGKRCLFTADNFFHHTQYSGSGGWMGLNRSTPAAYAESAKKVLAIAPEWVLAEHGGPYVFNAEDFRRRAAWGETAGKACDAVCVSGDHRRDWNPHAVSVEPCLVKAKGGAEVRAKVWAEPTPIGVKIKLRGRGIVPDQEWTIAASRQRQTNEVVLKLPEKIEPGRYIFTISPTAGPGEFADPWLAVDVE
ncbi:MAG: MBL fold metallo-hydrolase [Fimbriiglobus sp.]|nr:MBL fold metallo-hydrolase [Fimbriiglobus sp.]